MALAIVAGLCRVAHATEAFITDQDGDAVTVIDLTTRKTVATIHVDGKPAGIAMTRDGTRAYVTSPSMQMVSVIDTQARRVIGHFTAPGGPLGIAVHPSGSPIYVADWYSNQIEVFDAATGRMVGQISVGQSPSGLAGHGGWQDTCRVGSSLQRRFAGGYDKSEGNGARTGRSASIWGWPWMRRARVPIRPMWRAIR